MRIGDYVHWRYSNYLQHGLSVDGNEKANPDVIFNSQKTQILNSLKTIDNKDTVKRTIEQQINFFFDPTPQSIHTGYTAQEVEQIQKYLISIVEQTIKDLKPNLKKALVDYQTLEAKSTGGGSITLADGTTEEWAKIRKAADFNREGQTKTTIFALKRRILQLIAQRDKMANMVKSVADQRFLKGLDDLENKYKALFAEVKNSSSNKVLFYKDNRIRSDGTIENAGDFAKDMQNLINMTKHITNIEAQGIIGEVVPVVSQWAYDNFANKKMSEILSFLDNMNQKAVIDVIKKQVKGQETSVKIPMASKVLDAKKFKTNNNVQAQIRDIKLNTSATQDKVDIQLNFPDDEKINASVKNINLRSGHNINILDGANLITYIQDYPVFANHYLNVTANIHRGWDRAPRDMIQKAHETLKMTIALHALTGKLWAQFSDGSVSQTAQAEIFIVNDISNRHERFKVYFMSDLMQSLGENINYLKIKDFDENKSYYSNKWVGTQQHNMTSAWARISKILAQMRMQKLNVSISPKILT